jgi:glycosyltransferase involved in cell wall biosynthesis
MISVIIATKNGRSTIQKAIDSVLAQSIFSDSLKTLYSGAEIVVISDGSTDDVESFVSTAYPNSKFPVRVLRNEESVGPGKARKIAIEATNNAYIAILDDDDWWINAQKLENQIFYLESHPNIAVVGAQKTEFVNESGKHLFWYTHRTDPKDIHDNMLIRCPIINSSVVFKKSAYDHVGGYSDLRLAEDYDLWLRIGQVADIVNIPETETAYTLRKNSASGSNGTHSTKLAVTVLHLVQKYKREYPNYHKALLKAYLRIIRKFIFGF